MSGYGTFGGAKNRTPSAGATLYHGQDLGSDSLAGLPGAPLLFQPMPSSAGPARTVVRRPQGAPRAHRKKGSGAGRGPRVALLRTRGPGPALAFHLVGFLGGLGFLPPELTATSSAQLLGSKSLLQDFQDSAQRSPPAGSLAELPPAQGRGASGRLVP